MAANRSRTADIVEDVNRQLADLEEWAEKLEEALREIAQSYPETEEGSVLASIARDALK